MQNASRTGAICNMKIHEAKKSKRIGNTMSIVVLDHKTLTEGAGPVTLNLDSQVYKQLEIFIESVRPTVQSPSDHQMFVFVTGDEGKKLNTSQVSEQFNSFWKRAVGATERRPKMNATIFRKSCTTKVHSKHRDMINDLATLMNHKEETAKRSYFLQNKIQTAVRASEQLRRIMCEDSNHNDIPAMEEILKLFDNLEIENINLDLVKKMLMENNLLGKVDIKAVYREIKKSGNENSTIMDHVCRSGEFEKENDQDKENEVHIKDAEDHSVRTVEDDPFTEAGSSLCTTWVSYSNEEVSAVLSAFKDLIEGQCTIKQAEVMERFQTNPKLKDMLIRYDSTQLVNKVRTEKKAYQRKME